MKRERKMNNESGQSLVEYALILVLVAVAAIIILGILGGQIENVFQEISNAMSLP
jgi:pilus assembly protein Flp/PilA